ncbi:hypothetical protein IC608_11330 [Devosia sp. PTR5]|uniref:Uncharacterized protein n=1 Tax=Devosia oryzisoli TaxID=2774138 RepID=A0A927IT11_9HYPH|nr:hypothetical protein [Devosia oryzisoli]MBD8066064.1 hypothetical protein [Devosia oryzisoli]
MTQAHSPSRLASVDSNFSGASASPEAPQACQAVGNRQSQDNDTSCAAETSELDHLRQEIRAEINLLNNRLNALISSQAFLVIAYGTSLSAGYGDWGGLFTLLFPPLLAVLGFVLALEARPGILATHEAIGHWRRRENALIEHCPALRPFTLATDEESRRRMELRQHAGGLFSQRAPLIFLITWVIFLALPFALRLWG